LENLKSPDLNKHGLGYIYTNEQEIKEEIDYLTDSDSESELKNRIRFEEEKVSSLRLLRETLKRDIEEFEQYPFNFCQRISANRSLIIEGKVTASDKEESKGVLLYGKENDTSSTTVKWKDNSLQDDFMILLTAILSDAMYHAIISKQNPNQGAFDSMFDLILKIWNSIIPEKKIVYNNTGFFVEFANQSHNLSDLSDGENTVFYLIGQFLKLQKTIHESIPQNNTTSQKQSAMKL